jgi:NTP pyrophosphatase (non-canonical NTP hydrolase)
VICPKCTARMGIDPTDGYWTCFSCLYSTRKATIEECNKQWRKNKGKKMKEGRFIICGDCARNDETCSMCSNCVNGLNFKPKKKQYSDESTEKRECCDCKNNNNVDDICLQCDDYSRWEAKTNRSAATPEPMSKPGVNDVLPEVLKDLKARDEIGRKKYGTTLQTYNGRDALNDAYQETLDKAMYLKQEIMQRQDSFESKIAEWANERRLYDSATPYSQMKKLFEEILEWFGEVEAEDRGAEMLELGDCLVVLTNIANLRGFSLEQCGWMAYNKIKDRKGHIENGSFVKDCEPSTQQHSVYAGFDLNDVL